MVEGGAEVVEIDADRFVSLSFSRDWPRYVVSWTLRQRAGDGDFPLSGGSVSSLPPRGGTDLDAMWDGLRQDALAQATTSSEASASPANSEHQKRSLLNRLFGK